MASGQRRTSSLKPPWSASTGPRQDTHNMSFLDWLVNERAAHFIVREAMNEWMSRVLVRVEWNVTFKKALELLISCLCSWCSLAMAQKCICFPEHQTTTVHIRANSVKKKKGRRRNAKIPDDDLLLLLQPWPLQMCSEQQYKFTQEGILVCGSINNLTLCENWYRCSAN